MWAGGRSELIDRGYVGRGQVRDSRQGVCGQGGRSETIDMGYVGRG